MVVTEKRHMYQTGTVNVETGNVATKQDINYFNANVQSATKSIIRFVEDSDRRFSQNQIYDGATVSNGGATVDVASGTLKIGGRWSSLSGTGLSAAVSDGIYFVVAQVTGVSETNSRDPSGGEAVTLTLVSSGSYSATDLKLVLGSAVIATSGVTSVQDRAKRQINATIIKPYGSATQVSIYTGDSPVYREAIKFTADKILPYNDIESAFGISGSSITAIDFAIGSQVLDQSEFDNLVGLNQPVDTTQSPSFVQIQSTQDNSLPPFIVASTGTVVDLNADLLDNHHAPNGNIVGDTDLQTLNNKTLITPTIASYISGTHDHTNDVGGGLFDLNNLSGTLAVDKGGMGIKDPTDGGLLLGNDVSALEITARPTDGQILVGHGAGSPTLVLPSIVLSGDLAGSVNLTGSGIFNLSGSVNDGSHGHDTQYYTQAEINAIEAIGIANKKWASCSYNTTDTGIGGKSLSTRFPGVIVDGTTTTHMKWRFPLPLVKNGKFITFTGVRYRLGVTDGSNFVTRLARIYTSEEGQGEGVTDITTDDNSSTDEISYAFTYGTNVNHRGYGISLHI